MIKRIYLSTNRDLMAFDEEGKQIIGIEKSISWSVKSPERERRALKKIIKDKPKIYLSRPGEWVREITIEELCDLLGHGEWFREYWDKEKSKKQTVSKSKL